MPGGSFPSRRDFLHAVGGGLAATPVVAAPSTPKRVLVLGGGIAGLCCAYELRRRGHDPVVFEASDRPGGHVRTVRSAFPDGLYVDAGAEGFTKPGYSVFRRYLKEFGLSDVHLSRRDEPMRRVGGKWRTAEALRDPKLWRGLGYTAAEAKHLATHGSVRHLYLDKYIEKLDDEYDPFAGGMKKLDRMTVAELLEREGASPTAVRRAGSASALSVVWHEAILRLRGIPPRNQRELRRIEGGNERLIHAFHSRLGERVRLGHAVMALEHHEKGVTVRYRTPDGAKRTADGDYAVSCLSPPVLQRLSVRPPWPSSKQYILRNMPFYSRTRVAIVCNRPFWEDDGLSPTLRFGRPELSGVWQTCQDVDSELALLVGNAAGVGSSDAAVRIFRELYPGDRRNIDIRSAWTFAWPEHPKAAFCERTAFQPGELPKFWPEVTTPVGRVHFAGAWCDNLSWGMDAATRSANRVADTIDEA